MAISPLFDYSWQQRLQIRRLPQLAPSDEEMKVLNLTHDRGNSSMMGDRFVPSREAMQKSHSFATRSLKRPRKNYEEALVQSLFPNFSEQTLKNGPPKKFKLSPLPVPKWSFPEKHYANLAAPDFRNDFYCNNLHWGKNKLAVNLGDACYVLDSKTREVQLIFSSSINQENLFSLKWGPKGDAIAIGSSNSRVVVLDVETVGKILDRVSVLASQFHGTYCMDWLSAGELTVADWGNISHIDLRLQSPAWTINSSLKQICGLEWSPNHSLFARGGNDNKVKIYDVRNTSRSFFSYDHHSAVKALKWVPKSSTLFSGGGANDKTMKLFNTINGKQLCQKKLSSQICDVEFFNSRIFGVATGNNTNEIQFWDFNRKKGELKLMRRIVGGNDRILSISKEPNGLCFASVSADETLKLWEVKKAKKEIIVQRRPKETPTSFSTIR